VYREDEERAHGDPATFRRLTRDIFVAPSDIGFWQGALRDPEEPAFAEVRQAIEQRQRLLIDVLYADHEGGQRTITRWGLTPHESGVWLPTVTAHWNLDRDDPR
jgi:predicted DNA-binding transcriptional regulator YafY